MKENPVRSMGQARHIYQEGGNWHFTEIFKGKKLALRYVSLTIIIALLLGGAGISYAAQSSLPGDFLYPIKTGVNEKILGLTLFSREAKANYYFNLAQLRMEETEKLTAEGRLDGKTSDQVKNLINQHIIDAKKQLEGINSQDKASIITEIYSNLEESLNAHNKVLLELAGSQKKEVQDEIKNIISDVQKKISEAAKNRKDNGPNNQNYQNDRKKGNGSRNNPMNGNVNSN